jgi:hypothetical protein
LRRQQAQHPIQDFHFAIWLLGHRIDCLTNNAKSEGQKGRKASLAEAFFTQKRCVRRTIPNLASNRLARNGRSFVYRRRRFC